MSPTTALEQKTLAVSDEQAVQLRQALNLAKAFAAPGRLAILGLLAQRPQPVALAEIVAQVGGQQGLVERDVRQLAVAGLVSITWQADPGAEPTPQTVAFNRTYEQTINGVIHALHQLNEQLQPSERSAPVDERAQVLVRYLVDRRLISWPSQLKRQRYVAEEIASHFTLGRDYTEREVTDLLREIYAYDPVTIRRYLVDFKLLERKAGIYRRQQADAAASGQSLPPGTTG